MADRIILAYRRRHELVGDLHLADGYIDLSDGYREDFTELTFAKMVTRFAELAIENPEAKLFMMRLEQKPEPMALELSVDDSVLLRADPVRFIKLMSPPQRKVIVRDEKIAVKDSVVIRRRPIRAGHDTMADAFGDAVYLRMKRGGAVECPGCGRWGAGRHGARDDKGELIQPKNHGVFTCDKCGLRLVGKSIPKETGGWWAVHTEVLLTDGKRSRYYLPRVWNTDGPWINHGDLKKRYEEYLKEKACTETSTGAPSE